ncbi:SusC/RagA family TonB-linked outer membrane protein [Chitinophaga arvensicola]|uniref:TonB-linked outer membrane protein, SusC/RagA family n=1 Tax=Chitinophaga arvensicola TaxID=29529 RepID=A0A1I0S6F4_9BACT|nr:SusC/RagA family TonB-linked outer membrane protein [Chitinophaga arvensicola]SEW51080.1 TonB-linked outer membrane protein, SusC/RagA family [Chitinophaga arvensicola]
MRKLSGLSFCWKEAQGYVMRLPFGLLLLLMLAGNGLPAQGQEKPEILTRKISYQANKQPLSKVLKDLRTQMHIRFTYNSELIRRQAPVTVKMDGVPLESLLRQVLLNTGLQFIVEMGGIIIYEAEATTQKPGSLSMVVKGRVTDPQGQPLGGVSIKGLSSREMTITQPDGFFMLIATQQEQISLSLVGMKTLLYTAKPTKEELVFFQMDTVARAIQEVVINGYQKIDPRLATGSVLKLNAADILQPGQPSVDRMLQGKVPGLMVINSSGSVNAKPTLRIRGTSTLIGNAAPLWVVDGMIRPDPVNVSSAILNNLLSGPSQSNFDMMGNAISGLNPYDIESITFLRDAGATSIYGTRAANGVIVVTTKRGKAGPVSISYNTNVSFQARPRYSSLNLMNSKERVAFSKSLIEDGALYRGDMSGFDEQFSYEGLLRALYARQITETQFGEKVNTIQTRNTDWFKLLFRNQMSMQHSLSMSGGVGKTTYYASVNYADAKGAALLDGKKTYGANIGITSQIGKRLNLDLSMQSNYIKSSGYYQGVDPMSYALQTSRIYSPDDFYPVRPPNNLSVSQPLQLRNQPFGYNILNEINHSENNSSTQSTSVNLNMIYKISKHWSFNNTSNAMISSADGLAAADENTTAMAVIRGWDSKVTPTKDMLQTTDLPNGGLAYMMNQKSLALGLRNSIDYNTGFFKDRDQFSFTFGNEVRSETSNGLISVEPGYFPDRGKMFAPTTGGRQRFSSETITGAINNSLSFYSSATYSMMNRYVLSGNVRTDGSNRFGQYANSRFLPNYSIAARWNVTSENWFPATSLISDLQFRSSYGTQGNVIDVVGPNLIATYANPGTVSSVTGKPYMHIKSMPYPDLRWEKTYQWNIGTQIAMFDNRFSVNVDYYSKKTVDVLDMINIPFEYGMNGMYRNGSTLFNGGLETRINIDVIRSKNTLLSFLFTASKNINRVSDQLVPYNYSSFFNGSGHLPGRPVSGFYSYIYNGLSHDKGLPTFKNLNLKEQTTNPDDFLVYSGQMQPLFTGSIQPTFRYKSFSAVMSVYVSLGSSKRLNDPFLQTSDGNGTPAPFTNLGRDYFGRWRKPGDELKTDIPAMTDYPASENKLKIPYRVPGTNNIGTTTTILVDPMVAYNSSDFRTIRNNYLRCNFLNLNYNIPSTRLTGTGIKNLSIGVTVNNVFTIANPQLKGQDPEIDGAGKNALPLTRQYACSLNASF